MALEGAVALEVVAAPDEVAAPVVAVALSEVAVRAGVEPAAAAAAVHATVDLGAGVHAMPATVVTTAVAVRVRTDATSATIEDAHRAVVTSSRRSGARTSMSR